MFGHFIDNLFHRNVAEDMNRQEVEGQVDYANAMLEASQRRRTRYGLDMDELLEDETAQKIGIQNELHRVQLDLQRQTNDNIFLKVEIDKLKRERAALKETAVTIALSRLAMNYAVASLFGDEIIENIEALRKQELEILWDDRPRIDQLGSDIENAVKQTMQSKR